MISPCDVRVISPRDVRVISPRALPAQVVDYPMWSDTSLAEVNRVLATVELDSNNALAGEIARLVAVSFFTTRLVF